MPATVGFDLMDAGKRLRATRTAWRSGPLTPHVLVRVQINAHMDERADLRTLDHPISKWKHGPESLWLSRL